MKSQRGGFLVGLVLGLLIGLGVALGVALYITKAPIPFINKLPQRSAEQDAAEAERNKHWDPNAPMAGKNAMRAQPASSAASAASEPAAAPAPSAEPAVPASQAAPRSMRDPAALLGDRAAVPAPAVAASKPGSPAAAIASFFVQAGAYAKPEDAEAQRAKLALMGFGTKITEREQAGRTVFRVRLGPFDSREAAEDAQTRLSTAGIESNLVRVER